ncbi:hypothetical protein BDZ89DRAFT_899183, partial [Hymenopellis radicata]
DRLICRAFAYKLRHHLTDEGFVDLPHVFEPDADHSQLSLAAVRTRVAFLSGFKPQFYDCCPKSCVCYTGRYAEMATCPYCQEPRYRDDGKPRQKFTYLPIIPRLQAFAANTSVASAMQYRSTHRPSEQDLTEDIFDGDLYRRLCERFIHVNGSILSSKYFADARDVALGFSTDGFCPHKRRK